MASALIKLHIAILIAGLTGVFGKLIEANAFILCFYRIAIASIIFFIFMKVTKAFALPSARNLIRYLLVGGILATHWILFYSSIKLSNISVGVICLSTMGFFTAFLEPLIIKSPFSFKELGFSLLCILGIALIFSFDTQFRLGITVGLISSCFASLFTITNKRVIVSFDTKNVFLYEMFGAMIVMLALSPLYLCFFDASTYILSVRDIVSLLVLSSLCTIGLYLLQLDVARYISAFTINLSFNLEPLYSILIAIVLYHENKQMTLSFVIGLALIILSVIGQSVRVVKEQKRLNAKRT